MTSSHGRIRLRCGCYLAFDQKQSGWSMQSFSDTVLLCASHGPQVVMSVEGRMRRPLDIFPAA